MEPYQFKENSGQLQEQAGGLFTASFELSAYQGQNFHYEDKGVNADNYRVIDVNIAGDEQPPITYHPGQTPAFALDHANGVELVAKKDGKRKDGLSIIHA